MKEFADDNYKFTENGRKLFKWVENTVGKGEIARYEQFLLFPQCFQKACFSGVSKGVIVWEWVNVPGVKHRYMRGYPWVSNQFTSSLVGNRWCLRKFPTRPGIEPSTSGLIVKRFTSILPHHPTLSTFSF